MQRLAMKRTFRNLAILAAPTLSLDFDVISAQLRTPARKTIVFAVQPAEKGKELALVTRRNGLS
jgi:hypothetical protein